VSGGLAMNVEAPSFITPLTITFPMDGEEVTVKACSVAQLGAMLQLLKPVLPELQALPPEMLDRLVGDEGPSQADILVLLELMADHAALPAKLVAEGMGWPTDRVQALLPDRFAYLFAVLVQVNADFFGRALPVLFGAAGKFSALLPAAAPTPTTSGPSSSQS
jgi:hypothetical protein